MSKKLSEERIEELKEKYDVTEEEIRTMASAEVDFIKVKVGGEEEE